MIQKERVRQMEKNKKLIRNLVIGSLIVIVLIILAVVAVLMYFILVN